MKRTYSVQLEKRCEGEWFTLIQGRENSYCQGYIAACRDMGGKEPRHFRMILDETGEVVRDAWSVNIRIPNMKHKPKLNGLTRTIESFPHDDKHLTILQVRIDDDINMLLEKIDIVFDDDCTHVRSQVLDMPKGLYTPSWELYSQIFNEGSWDKEFLEIAVERFEKESIETIRNSIDEDRHPVFDIDHLD